MIEGRPEPLSCASDVLVGDTANIRLLWHRESSSHCEGRHLKFEQVEP